MLLNVNYPILQRMLGYIDDLQLHHKYQCMTIGVQVPLLIAWHEYVQ